jgi:uncharacterized membrane protein YhfC
VAYALLAVNGLLMILVPLTVGTWIARRYHVEWGFFGAGALTFVAAQVFHVPFNVFVESRFLPQIGEGFSLTLLSVVLFYGLSAGVFEECARYIMYRYWRRDARTWAEGLMVGAGHGGIEALILGFIFVINTTVLLGLANGHFLALVPEGSLAELESQASALLNLPPYQLILGGVERVLTIFVHLALSLMVLRAVGRRAPLWLLGAISWHTLLNAAALLVASLAGPAEAELAVAAFSVVSIWLISRWRDGEDDEVTEGLPEKWDEQPRPAIALRDVSDKIDDSRYTK